MPTIRCPWGETTDQLYQTYHDQEWGKLNLNENYLYEMLVLESFQSGLSWATILHKRENFRLAFANFDFHKVANFTEKDYQQLLKNTGIVRNKSKIKAAINNARIFVQLEQQGSSFANFLQRTIAEPIINHPQKMADVLSQDTNSQIISKEMKKAGFKFVGPTTIYSFLQAVGLINDHLENCSFKY